MRFHALKHGHTNDQRHGLQPLPFCANLGAGRPVIRRMPVGFERWCHLAFVHDPDGNDIAFSRTSMPPASDETCPCDASQHSSPP